MGSQEVTKTGNTHHSLLTQGVSIRKWIEERLSQEDESAIGDYIQSLPPKDMETGYAQLRNLVERQEIRLGNSVYKTVLFAVPIVITTSEDMAPQGQISFNSQLLPRSFQQFGLTSKTDGIVLLDALVGHDFFDSFKMTELYKQANSLFMSAVAGAEKSRVRPIALTSVQSGYEYQTLCFTVGLAYWKQGRQAPLFLSEDAATVGGWADYVRQIVRFAAMTRAEEPISAVQVGRPTPLFGAIDAGRWMVTRSIVDGIFNEYNQLGEELKANISVVAERLPGTRDKVLLELTPANENMPSTSLEFTTDERMGNTLPIIIASLRGLLGAHGVPASDVAYS